MKLSNDLEEALNKQIGFEFASAHSYLSMSAHFESEAWEGFAAWKATQSDEERGHAMRFYHYLLDRDGSVRIPEIPAPRSQFTSPLEVFEVTLQQEQDISKSIFALYKMAHDSDDYATVSFLKWFVDEQVEEEKLVSDMVDRLMRAAGNNEAILLLDRQAGERTADGDLAQ